MVGCLKWLVDPWCLIHSGNSNPGIRELPAELGQLSNLWQLDLEDLNITNVPQDVRNEGAVLNIPSTCVILYNRLIKKYKSAFLKENDNLYSA